ncbi:DUF4251 domain-containing protein [Aridibaculum aurantiacum]|uniref:DUF4251 domain-containing protein n=1 Tax=Aridibaculum aurantiacum TaxID=2810307 RepID=UPI001A976770|nr:DUF4251 domain-containing protein [Aridibaculum aurantiacum]
MFLRIAVILSVISTAIFTSCSTASNTSGTSNSEAVNLVKQRSYIFQAQSITPQGGGLRPLTPEYELTVSKDTIHCFLPYMGRSFTAPMDPRQIGLDFNSTNFEYQETARRNGRIEITIIPKDNREVRQMNLSVSPDGFAMLNVGMLNKQPVAFNGIIIRRTTDRR